MNLTHRPIFQKGQRPQKVPAILADPGARARWIAWRVRLRARRAERALFRSCRRAA